MDEERISRLLGSLPREQASPHFTAAVLRRLEESAAPPRRTRLRLAVAACVAVLLAAGTFGMHQWSQERARDRQRQAALVRLEALEAEKRALESELSALARLARDARPVVYLDSTPKLDMVVDLNRLARRARASGGRIQPASHSTTAPSRTRPKGEHRR